LVDAAQAELALAFVALVGVGHQHHADAACNHVSHALHALVFDLLRGSESSNFYHSKYFAVYFTFSEACVKIVSLKVN